MKWKFKDSIIKKAVNDTTVLYNADSGAYYGVRGALKHYFMENDEFEEADIIDYLVQNFGIDYAMASEDSAELLSDFVKSEVIEVAKDSDYR